MAKQVMRRRASDNEYLHKDFHGALSVAIEYIHERYGEQAVRDYLWQFARSYYAPLTVEVNRRGLAALAEHFRRVYEIEGGEVNVSLSEDELVLKVRECPAVMHMRRRGYPVARLFRETIATVNRAICHGTPFEAELSEYDERTGRSVQRFYRRKA